MIPEPVSYIVPAVEKPSAELREYLARLGRKGGKKGGPARAAAMTAEQRSESARKAVMARWTKKKRSESL